MFTEYLCVLVLPQEPEHTTDRKPALAELTQTTAISQADKNNKLSTWPRSSALTLMQNIQNILCTMARAVFKNILPCLKPFTGFPSHLSPSLFTTVPQTPCPHLCLPLWQSYTCHKSSAQATLCDQKALTRERQTPELLLLTQQLKHDLRGFADHSSLHGCPHLRWLMMSFQDVLHMFSHLSVCLIGIQAPSEMGSVTSSPLDS